MRTILLTMTLCCLMPGLGWAQASEEEQREACGPDVMQFCAAEIPNRNRITQCLEAKRNQISPDCRVMLDGGRPARRQ